jgi:hypothetical protein
LERALDDLRAARYPLIAWQSEVQRQGRFTVIDESRVAEREIYEGMAPAIRFLAHGLGLSLHEEPFIAAHTDTLLQKQ